MISRITPAFIDRVAADEVFVFGSNLAGVHGAGAARDAILMGARFGLGEGISGRTYAIPTKPADLSRSLPLSRIRPYVERFTVFARTNPKFKFLVTPIGCGLAGYHPKDISPLFREAAKLENVWLPESFWAIIGGSP
jgi:hypothetical protein